MSGRIENTVSVDELENRCRYQELSVVNPKTLSWHGKEFRRGMLQILDSLSSRNGDSHLFHFLALACKSATMPGKQVIVKQDFFVQTGEVCLCMTGEKRWNPKNILGVKNEDELRCVLNDMVGMHLLTYKILKRYDHNVYRISLNTDLLWLNEEPVPGQYAFYTNSGFILLRRHAVHRLLRLYQNGRKVSTVDMLLDMWMHCTVNDPLVAGSFVMPVVKFAYNEIQAGCHVSDPRISLEQLAERWGVSKATVSRRLADFAKKGWINYYKAENALERDSKGILVTIPRFCGMRYSKKEHVVTDPPMPSARTAFLAVEVHKNGDESYHFLSDDLIRYVQTAKCICNESVKLADLDVFYPVMDHLGGLDDRIYLPKDMVERLDHPVKKKKESDEEHQINDDPMTVAPWKEVKKRISRTRRKKRHTPEISDDKKQALSATGRGYIRKSPAYPDENGIIRHKDGWIVHIVQRIRDADAVDEDSMDNLDDIIPHPKCVNRNVRGDPMRDTEQRALNTGLPEFSKSKNDLPEEFKLKWEEGSDLPVGWEHGDYDYVFK